MRKQTTNRYLIIPAIGLAVITFLILFKLLLLPIINRMSHENKFIIDVSEEIVVAQADEKELEWGYFQFPRLSYGKPGELLLKFAYKPDAYTDYEGKYLYYKSIDNGATWQECLAEDYHPRDTRMDNGCYFEGAVHGNAIDQDMDFERAAYVSDDTQFAVWHVDQDINASFECVEYDEQDNANHVFESRLIMPWPSIVEDRGVVLPEGIGIYHYANHNPHIIIDEGDGDLFLAYFNFGFDEHGNVSYGRHYNIYFFRSSDSARTWEYVSQITTTKNICPAEKEGLCEPTLLIAPDGRYVCLLRTDSDSPGYITYSIDKGSTWTEPQLFDGVGVDPQMITLDCGVTIASYGRPGIFIRATDDPKCRRWRDPISLQVGGNTLEEAWESSCCYTSLIPIDTYNALIAYSDFQYPSKEGVGVAKTILVRKITVEY